MPTPTGRRRVVLNFMIVPGYGIARDMKEVERAAEDYQERHRGAAQVQVVFDPAADLPDRLERDRIFRELLAPALPAIRTIMDVSPGAGSAIEQVRLTDPVEALADAQERIRP